MSEQAIYCGQCSDAHGVATFHDLPHKTVVSNSEISNLEWAVLEAVVKWHCRPLGEPRYQEHRDLAQAVDALIAARERAEEKAAK